MVAWTTWFRPLPNVSSKILDKINCRLIEKHVKKLEHLFLATFARCRRIDCNVRFVYIDSFSGRGIMISPFLCCMSMTYWHEYWILLTNGRDNLKYSSTSRHHQLQIINNVTFPFFWSTRSISQNNLLDQELHARREVKWSMLNSNTFICEVCNLKASDPKTMVFV